MKLEAVVLIKASTQDFFYQNMIIIKLFQNKIFKKKIPSLSFHLKVSLEHTNS